MSFEGWFVFFALVGGPALCVALLVIFVIIPQWIKEKKNDLTACNRSRSHCNRHFCGLLGCAFGYGKRWVR